MSEAQLDTDFAEFWQRVFDYVGPFTPFSSWEQFAADRAQHENQMSDDELYAYVVARFVEWRRDYHDASQEVAQEAFDGFVADYHRENPTDEQERALEWYCERGFELICC